MFQGTMSSFTFTHEIYNEPFINHSIDYNANPRNHKSFIEHNQILIPTKKSPKIQFLVETFPHLHTLIVSTDGTVSKYVDSLIRLIAHYRTKLVTLQLYFGYAQNGRKSKEIPLSNIMANLLQLNSLISLQHLTVYTEDSLSKFEIKPQTVEPEFLTRLKEFYFKFGDLENVMFDWMRKYDKAGRLGGLERYYLSTQTIAYHNRNFRSWIDQIDHVPQAHLYSFSPYKEYENYELDLRRIVARFPSLITLRHKLNEQSVDSLTKLTSILSPLTKLVHLYLEIEGNTSYEPLNLNSNSTPAQLTSLKALDLYVDDYERRFMPTFCQTQVQTIVQCFPNMQSIRITAEDSANSGYESDYKYEEKPDLEECANHFFDQLKVAYGRESLRTEYYNPYSRDGDD